MKYFIKTIPRAITYAMERNNYLDRHPLLILKFDLIIVIDHSGFVREAEQRGDKGGEPLRERPPQAHDSARPREDILGQRQHHHIQDPLRQYYRQEIALKVRVHSPVECNLINPSTQVMKLIVI